MTANASSVAVIGASVAGVGVAHELRRLGFEGEITLADAQPHPPYDRPPLSKSWLTSLDGPPSFYETAHYENLGISLRLGTRAVGLHAGPSPTVALADGASLTADAVVLATGATPRRLPQHLTAGALVHVIREADDAHRLRLALREARSLVVIGAGFIGSEVASICAELGLRVTMVEADPQPFKRVLGSEVAEKVAALHRAHGVELHTGVSVVGVRPGKPGNLVDLSDGQTLVADVVVAGLGATPCVEWLADSPVVVDDGIVCDDVGFTGMQGVYAVGDAARWPRASGQPGRRTEHWTAARDQARIAAQRIAGADDIDDWSAVLPYVWTDLYGSRLQMLGDLAGADEVRFAIVTAEGKFLALYGSEGRLVGIAAVNLAAKAMRMRTQLSARTTLDDVVV